MTKLPALLLLAAALFLVACGSDDSSSSNKPAATAKADACTKASLKTQTPGTLTVATAKAGACRWPRPVGGTRAP